MTGFFFYVTSEVSDLNHFLINREINNEHIINYEVSQIKDYIYNRSIPIEYSFKKISKLSVKLRTM